MPREKVQRTFVVVFSRAVGIRVAAYPWERDSMSTATVLILIVGILAVAGLFFYMWRQQRSKQLRTRYGPEYQQAVQEYGSRERAEQALVNRQKRMEKIKIQPLSAPERDRFAGEWVKTQAL